ncbi:hypothetical protein CJ030_MR2G018512 [Morella rubra]|uniref:DUF599 domain-containing protein n=1 Tax=Morella rubra TaxID=262757 RepID=A0A6A1WGM6_9ROSI|nr:hypothetical protein CJ030_MR2G018512 [Morella rubra]
MGFDKEHLDLVLVPCGLLILFVYHIVLLYKYLYKPQTTLMGHMNNDKKAWDKDISRALSVISSNTWVSIYLAIISLTLCSLIGAWISRTSNNFFQSSFIFGDTRATTISIKYICLLTCFLLAFSCFIQSARHLVHGSYLISNPSTNVPMTNAELAMVKAGENWSLGLRALYFAASVMLWFFGPIPMFVSAIATVVILHFVDSSSPPWHHYESDASQSDQTVKKTG